MQKPKKILFKTLSLFACILFFSIVACKHEPILPDNYNPNDTIINPNDTTTNDTTSNDTITNPNDTITNPNDTIPIDTTTYINPDPCDPDSVYFQTDIMPILAANCALSGCHNAQSHKEGVILDNYTNTKNTGDLNSTNPTSSDLYKAIISTSPDKIMPPPPYSALSASQIAVIKKWIEQGSKNLTCSPDPISNCDTANVTFSLVVKPIIQNYCINCHKPNSPGGNVDLSTYTGVKAAADNGKLYGSIQHLTGYSPMPKYTNKLNNCYIANIRYWIEKGAPND